MNATTWLSSKLNLLRNSASAAAETPQQEDRSTRERLDATLRQKKEALSPRTLRRTLTLLQAVVDPRVSEVEGGRRAKALADWYAKAEPAERQDLWLLISEQFGPDAVKVRADPPASGVGVTSYTPAATFRGFGRRHAFFGGFACRVVAPPQRQ